MHATLRPVQTRFRSGSGVIRLNLATYIKSPIHDAKGTESRVALAGHSAFPPHFLGYRIFFLLLEVLRCFTSLGSLVRAYGFSAPYGGITRRGFPHSDISGSKPG